MSDARSIGGKCDHKANAKETYTVVESMIDLNEYERIYKTMNFNAFIPRLAAASMPDLMHSNTLVSMIIKADVVRSYLIVQEAANSKY